MLGDLYNLQGKIHESLEALRLSLNSYHTIGYKKLQGVYVLLVKNYNYLTDYQNALYYGLLAIKASESTEMPGPQLIEIENTVANTYYHLGEEKEAISHFSKSLKLAQRINDTAGIYTVTPNLCLAYLRFQKPLSALATLNEIARQYSKKKNFDYKWNFSLLYLRIYSLLNNLKMAKTYYEDCESLLHDPQLPDDQKNEVYIELILYLDKTHQFEKALDYSKNYTYNAERYHSNFQRMQSFQIRYRIDSLTGNYKSAFIYALRFQKLSDSIFNVKKFRQIHEIEATFKTKEKDDSIELLNQKNKLQQEGLKNAQRTANESIAGICFLLIGGGYFTWQYQVKRKAYSVIAKQNELIIDKNEVIVFKNRELESLVQEKEYLVQEIHHRVKNNLHTVLGFLTLQSNYLNGDALAAIKISRQRIYAMSLIHQKLYLSQDVKTIEIKPYLQELISYFQECLEPNINIHFVLDIDDVRLPVSKAIPVGLIINEGVTNSVKYAFPLKREGIITIKLKIKNDLIDLLVADNGIGISMDANNTDFNSLGIKLIKGLCGDLGGQINFDSRAGTKISISFSVES